MSYNGGYERRPYFQTAASVAVDVGRVPVTGLDTPYLGVEPPPSRPVGQVLRIVLALAAVVAVGRALLLLVRASLDTRLTHGRTDLLIAQLHGNQTALRLVSVLSVLSVVAVVVTKSLWNRQRRPRQLARTHGEAYIELPMKVVLPAGLRYAMCGAFGLAVLGGFRGVVPTGAPLATFASHRHWAAAASLALAALWIFHGALVVIADRRHDERVARSADQRADPTSVPYVPAVSEYGAGPAGQPAGIGWIFRTAGLFTLVLTGAIFVLVGLQSFTSHVLSSGLWVVIGVSLEILVVRAVVRRWARSRHGESPSSPIHDEVPLARL